jgi:hypothetical protein
MSLDELKGEKVFVQEYLASCGWGGMVRKLGMEVVEDNTQLHLSTVERFLISQAKLGIVAADSQHILDDVIHLVETRNGLVMAKNNSVIYKRINDEVESAGLVGVWAKGIDHGILGQAFLDLLARQAASY